MANHSPAPLHHWRSFFQSCMARASPSKRWAFLTGGGSRRKQEGGLDWAWGSRVTEDPSGASLSSNLLWGNYEYFPQGSGRELAPETPLVNVM